MFDWVNLETLAVVLSIAYLILAMKENSLCWYCAFFSTAIYVWIFGDVNLYMESGLNLYYMAMAIYGWHQWQQILDFCHIAVSSRPGYEQPEAGPLVKWIACHRSDDLSEIKRKPSGCIYFCDLSMLDISSTNIRVKVAKGDDVHLMLPDSVISYIQKNRLYE